MIDIRHIFRNLIVPGAFRIPKTVSVNGNIDASVSGRIDGDVKGAVKTTGKLVVGETANIRGDVHAIDLVVHGKVYGDVYASKTAHISNKAQVKGDVNALMLKIEEGAVIGGAIQKNITDMEAHLRKQKEMEAEVPTEELKEAPTEEQQDSWF
ncbi:bactofilin family protein [Chitinophaga silvatica]|uniref:bactofilin family protein n=1 Tax=Chitinophaga silvatica TaxID=2282649 RepID=UPI00131457E1|nr:polymer-forming cytoskeletal protein [Chitinophaga silvatica]